MVGSLAVGIDQVCVHTAACEQFGVIVEHLDRVGSVPLPLRPLVASEEVIAVPGIEDRVVRWLHACPLTRPATLTDRA